MLDEFYKEEIQDEQKYLEYAKKIENTYPKYSKIFKDLAHEESTHAFIIKNMVKHMGEHLDIREA